MTNVPGETMETSNLSFSTILDLLKKSRGSLRAARKGWNGKGTWVSIHYPDVGTDKMSFPYLYMKTVTGDLIPWVVFHTDLMCDDWELVLPT
jgi:hypothetical protein